MAQNVLIAGAPGIGKTSLISRLYRDLTPLFIRGFYKEAIHEYRLLKGYRLATFDFQELILAHVHIVGPERIGQFGLNLDGFNELITHQLTGGKFTNSILNPNFPRDLTALPNPIYGRPYRADSFILQSAGPDGIYGTPDDIYNFNVLD